MEFSGTPCYDGLMNWKAVWLLTKVILSAVGAVALLAVLGVYLGPLPMVVAALVLFILYLGFVLRDEDI